ncbi:MAG: esterase family protein [Marinilabiliales bacterium]|nr:esterase family protein [Marinilabiliales bacterium]
MKPLVSFWILLFVLLLMHYPNAAQNVPTVASGSVQRLEDFHSVHIQPRNVDIWLPEGYDGSKRYSVLYFHDGQMLFDSSLTWNHQEWKADETIGRLIREKKMEPCIVVGIWNKGNDRIKEYFPDKIFQRIGEKTRDRIRTQYFHGDPPEGDRYLKFIATELKPYIDSHFATLPDRNHTLMAGSSMGGLISVYAICEYPEIWGGMASLSTAWLNQIDPGYEVPLAVFNYLSSHLPAPGSHRLYFDYGTGEADAGYVATQSFVDHLCRSTGYYDGVFSSRIFEKEMHNETAWSKRLSEPLLFMLPVVKPQKVETGHIDLFANFPSQFVPARTVEVWLPEGYSPGRKYEVLYMHDGQMLFDSASSWNHQSWKVQQVVAQLKATHKVKEFLVVAIHNGGSQRHAEYFPQKPFESMTPEEQTILTKQLTGDKQPPVTFVPVSDAYLRFIAEELKPFIEKNYPVRIGKQHAFLAGSSMGGLISLYALCEYPNLFGGAACLSTHWPGSFTLEGNPFPEAMIRYLSQHLPDPRSHRVYFDHGDQTLDALYPSLQKRVDQVMQSKGYGKGNWQTRLFPGKDHSERAWHERLEVPLEFLFGR